MTVVAASTPDDGTDKFAKDKPFALARDAGVARHSLLSVSFALNVAGIYACFMACSLLHESIYRTRSPTGSFLSPFVLNALEALANALVAAAGIASWEGRRTPPPQRGLVATGALQVLSKYCGSASRVYGLPGPVLTLVKSARPLPVMLGQRLVAGTRYTAKEYFQYLLVVAASILVGAAKSTTPTDGVAPLALLFLSASTLCDGYVGGRQKEMKESVRVHRRSQGCTVEDLQPFEMQFFTNLYMFLTAALFALFNGDWGQGLQFFGEVPVVGWKVAQYAASSAVGQVFVFTCVSRFDPLTLSVVTSSRKLVSVMVTLVIFGYEVNSCCLAGLALASLGFGLILSEEVGRQGRKASSGTEMAEARTTTPPETPAPLSEVEASIRRR